MVQALPIKTDLVVQSADGGVLALVEVKNRENLTAEIAAVLRRNVVEDAPASWWAPFFILVSQDVGYLWDQRSLPRTDGADAPLPTASFPMEPVIEHHLPAILVDGRLYNSHVLSAVARWLADLASGLERRPKQPETALERTDFPRLIRGGRVWPDIEY
jgi:hypothetical protein